MLILTNYENIWEQQELQDIKGLIALKSVWLNERFQGFMCGLFSVRALSEIRKAMWEVVGAVFWWMFLIFIEKLRILLILESAQKVLSAFSVYI